MMTKIKPFNQLKTAITGEVGEMIVKQHFKSAGLSVYSPSFSQPNPIDGFFIQQMDDGFKIFAFEVKTYPRRYTRAANGIDRKDFYTYRDLAKHLRVFIVFVDPFERCIYSLDFSRYFETGSHEQGKVYFDLDYMAFIRDLEKSELNAINWRPTPHYRNVEKYFAK